MSDRWTVWLVRGTALAAGAVGGGVEWLASPNADPVVLAFDLAVGWSAIFAAVLAVGRPGARRLAALWIAGGLSWFLGAATAPLATLAYGFFAHALTTIPTGRAERPSQQMVIALGYALAALLAMMPVAGLSGVLFGVVAFLAVRRVTIGAGPRRGVVAAAIGSTAIAVTFVGVAVAGETGILSIEAARVTSSLALVSTTLTLAVRLRWGSTPEVALAQLVIDLGDRPEAATLRERLADALDDSALQIGYRVDGSRAGSGQATYVDEAGRPLRTLPAGRVVVPLVVGGREVAVLLRDAASSTDPRLADGVAAAAQLALGNAQLQADTRRQVAEVEQSRARLIDVAERERQRIREDLDRGAMRRLLAVKDRIEILSGLGDERERLLEHARLVIQQLSDLSAGLGPTSELRAGLRPALDRLVRDAPVPARLSITADGLTPSLEALAYYVCAEGLANVTKHARATRVEVTVRAEAGRLRIEVLDDGVGGARPGPGTGLAGLRERVAALGGQLVISQPSVGGTRLSAEVPLPSSEPANNLTVPPARTA